MSNNAEIFYTNTTETKILTTIAKNAIKEFKKEERDKTRRTILHNTEVLLKEFLEIEYFFKNCDDSEVVENEEIVVKSLRQSKMATALLYHHAEKCLGRLNEQEPEKYQVIYMLYLDPDVKNTNWQGKIENIEEILHISKKTVYRWKDDMISKLSIMLFGADGYRLLIH